MLKFILFGFLFILISCKPSEGERKKSSVKNVSTLINTTKTINDPDQAQPPSQKTTPVGPEAPVQPTPKITSPVVIVQPSPIMNRQPAASCAAPSVLNSATNKCVCNAPNLSVGGVCQVPVSCAAPSVLNSATNKCVCNAPNLSVGGVCQVPVSCAAPSVLNSATNKCVCNAPNLSVGGVCQVPVSCAAPSVLNSATNKCVCNAPNLSVGGVCQVPVSCAAPSVLNSATNKCVCNAPNLSVGGVCQVPVSCAAPSVLNSATNKCVCNAPNLSVGGVCQVPVNCAAPSVLNSATNKCVCNAPNLLVGGVCQVPVNCAAPSVLNPITNTCLCNSPNVIINGICQIKSNCIPPSVLNAVTNTCQMVAAKPARPYVENGTPLSDIVAATSGDIGSKRVIIQRGEIAYIDINVDIGELIIDGELHCSNNVANAEIKARTIYVNGLFKCGSNSEVFGQKLIISLKHTYNLDPKLNSNYRGLIVNSGGVVDIKSDASKAVQARLNKTIEPTENTVYLDRQVNWKIGDAIVLAPSSFESTEGEVLKISEISGNPSVIKLNKSVQYRHWGKTQSLSTPRGEVVLDHRAEVANLTRNILIRADESEFVISSADIQDAQLGGHMMVNKGGVAYVDGVEFSRMGQAGIMGRYPFHWHNVGDAIGQYIKNSSIHDSFQRCITIHETNNALIDNNVCFKFKGHGFFFETGNEIKNTMTRNLGIGAGFPSSSKILLSSDNPNHGVPRRFPPLSVFWISNPDNIIENNIAAGSAGTGFWMSFSAVTGSDHLRRYNPTTDTYDGEILAHPLTTNTLSYKNNTAHSTMVGHTWDGGTDFNVKIGNANNPSDRALTTAHYQPPTPPVFSNLTAYKNAQAGIYFRGDTAIFENTILADNGWNIFVAYNQIFKKTSIVAKSENYTNKEDLFLYNRGLLDIVGILMYDGPFELDQVDFFNFPTEQVYFGGTEFTPTPFLAVGGSEKFTNIVNRLTFTPEPFYRVKGVPPVYNKLVTGWQDVMLANNIRDIDGSLTGSVNALVLPADSLESYSNCWDKNFNGHPSFYFFKICPANTKTATFMILVSGERGDNALHNPFVLRRNDGAVSFPFSKWDILDVIGDFTKDFYNRKQTILASPDFSYEIMFKNTFDNKPIFTMNTEYENQFSPIIKVVGYGSNCIFENATAVTTLQALNSVQSTSFYSSGNELYIKMKSVAPIWYTKNKNAQAMTKESISNNYRLICSAPLENRITGVIDGVTTNNQGTFISGWACDFGKSNSISTHLYLKGQAGLGVFVEAIPTNNTSEDAVAFACGDLSKTGHRFSYRVPENILSQYPGESIFIHGISTSGRGENHLLIGGSGNYKLPGTRITQSCTLNGQVIAANASVNVFEQYFVPQGQTCRQETRVCNNGVLSGSFTKTNCTVNNRPSGEIVGVIDPVQNTSSGFYISGWACDYGKNAQVQVHFYLGGPAGVGIGIDGSLVANQGSELAVSQACGDGSEVGHRYRYRVSDQIISQHHGKTIYMHGISTSGKEHSLLNGSGIYTIP